VIFSMFGSSLFGQAFFRVGEVPLPAIENAGFGNMIAGVDLDGDGYPEVYAVNNNWADNGAELIPRIYKFEFNGINGWDLVWSATLDIPLQNTWPALTIGDLDGDGKPEVIWGPVNFTNATTNPNPARIVVFEVKGDGSDELGVPDPNNVGNFLPNATWTITDQDNENHRPFRWFATDIDNDAQQELVMVTRAGPLHFAVVSVSDIPDNGDGSETWTLEAWDDSNAAGGTTYYDLAVIDSSFYMFRDNGDVTPVTYDNGVYTVHPAKVNFTNGGSWNSASVVDIDNDGTEEIVVGSWGAGSKKVFLIQGYGDGITSTEIADFTTLTGGGRLNGGAAGDINGDGRLDFVFGSRESTPNGAIVRLSYQGGPIDQAASYAATVIDQEYQAGGRWMHIGIGDLDGDDPLEVIYGEGTGGVAPLVVLDITGDLPVELTSFGASVVDGFVQLKWATATEINNHGFEVQRKSGESDFSTIGFVQGKGTTTESQSYSYVDSRVEEGIYSYRLKQVDHDGSFAYSDVVEIDITAPIEFSLSQNYPNPFNPVTTINFSLAVESNVTLKIFNTLGEEVAILINSEVKNAGTHNVRFDAASFASGTYIYRLEAGEFVQTKKMNLLK
jgi:hypothetical protein